MGFGFRVSVRVRAVDYGSYYASASLALSDGRRIVFAWVLEGEWLGLGLGLGFGFGFGFSVRVRV